MSDSIFEFCFKEAFAVPASFLSGDVNISNLCSDVLPTQGSWGQACLRDSWHASQVLSLAAEFMARVCEVLHSQPPKSEFQQPTQMAPAV